ncbi:hypothetical protein FIBSPDRAFT_865225, partial [Athelia psychrophila]
MVFDEMGSRSVVFTRPTQVRVRDLEGIDGDCRYVPGKIPAGRGYFGGVVLIGESTSALSERSHKPWS